MAYEYKVVPAPTRGLKAKGVKTPEGRFANALEATMNELATDGWEYLRTDTLPSEQRDGLMSKTTVYQNVMVFRRGTGAPAEEAPAAREAADDALVLTPQTQAAPAVKAPSVTAEPSANPKPAPTPERPSAEQVAD